MHFAVVTLFADRLLLIGSRSRGALTSRLPSICDTEAEDRRLVWPFHLRIESLRLKCVAHLTTCVLPSLAALSLSISIGASSTGGVTPGSSSRHLPAPSSSAIFMRSPAPSTDSSDAFMIATCLPDPAALSIGPARTVAGSASLKKRAVERLPLRLRVPRPFCFARSVRTRVPFAVASRDGLFHGREPQRGPVVRRVSRVYIRCTHYSRSLGSLYVAILLATTYVLPSSCHVC
jgi:hypothetical protein